MNCYCCPHQQCMCIPYGSCYVEQPKAKKMTMLERQGIWMQVKSIQQEAIPKCRPKMTEYWQPSLLPCPQIPSVKVTKDTAGPFLSSHSNLNVHDGKIVRDTLWMTDSKYYDENRGPILRIKGWKIESILTYKEFMKLDEDGDPIEPEMEDYSEFYPEVENLFVYDEMEPFSATTKCKQVKHLTISNEGTVAIRYQWLRTPPTRALRTILGHPGRILNVFKPPNDNDEPFFWKDTCYEFHFRELPGIILPGQSIQFPIIFRPRQTGYFHEKLYLMTHPRISDEDDRIFNLRLSGICMDPDCPLPQSKSCKVGKEIPTSLENMKRQVKNTMLYQEATDCLNSILDTVLFDHNAPKSTLPFGKITAEQIFYAHNPGLHYNFNIAEKTLEEVRSLVTMLVPKSRIIDNENLCPLSIKNLYLEIARSPPEIDYFWNNFKSPEAEQKLKDLAESTKVLVKPRVFSWPTKDTRIHSSCYTSMVALMTEIVTRIENIDFNANNPEVNRVLRAEIKHKLVKKKMKEDKRHLRHPTTPNPSLYGEDDGEGMLTTGLLNESTYDPNNVQIPSSNEAVIKTDTSSSKNAGISVPLPSDDETLESQLGESTDEEEEGQEQEERNRSNVNHFDGMQYYQIPEEELEAELKKLKDRKEKQAKCMLFETLFGCGVERMMSTVDLFRNMYDYKGSDVIRKLDTCSLK